MVRTTSTVGRFSTGCRSTGMPRPLSSTRTPPSASRVTLTVSQKPASASSTPLSTTSHTMWCRPRSPVDPMYMPGRLRTASRPSSTVMELPEYAFSVLGRATTWGPSLSQRAHDGPDDGGGARGRRTALSRLLAVSAHESTRTYDRNAAVHALRPDLRHFRLVRHHRCWPGP